MQPAQVVVDGYLVVVEDDEQVCFRGSGVVDSFECKASGQGAVPDQRGHFLFTALYAGGFSEPEGG